MKIKHAVLLVLLSGILFVVTGCDDVPRNFNAYVDLNGDKKPEIVFGNYGKEYWTYRDYDTYVAKNDGSGNFGSPELINRQRR